MGRVSKYPEEFRRQAASLVVDGHRPVREVARELDVNHETLRNCSGSAEPTGRREAGRIAMTCGGGSRVGHAGVLGHTRVTGHPPNGEYSR